MLIHKCKYCKFYSYDELNLIHHEARYHTARPRTEVEEGEMNDIPFLAIGNDELGKDIGTHAPCPKCKKKHKVEYGNRILENGDKVPSKTLGFVKCGKDSYLVAIEGLEIG